MALWHEDVPLDKLIDDLSISIGINGEPGVPLLTKLVERVREEERKRWGTVLRAWARQTSIWAARATTEHDATMNAWRLSALDDAAEAIEDNNDKPVECDECDDEHVVATGEGEQTDLGPCPKCQSPAPPRCMVTDARTDRRCVLPPHDDQNHSFDPRLDVLEAAENICRETSEEYELVGRTAQAGAAEECAHRIASFASTFRPPV
jgi:hypothetical protein